MIILMSEVNDPRSVSSIDVEWGNDLMSGFRVLPRGEVSTFLKSSAKKVGHAAIVAANSVETWVGDRLEQRALRRMPSALADSVLPPVPLVDPAIQEVI